MKSIEPIILRAAQLVRAEFEELLPGLDPHNFSPDTLQGACGIASRTLHRALKRLGCQNDFVMGHWADRGEPGYDSHCWVEVPRLGVLVDVTATQFRYPEKVLVLPVGGKHVVHWRNQVALQRLATLWHGQSDSFYRPTLKEIENRVVANLKKRPEQMAA